MRRTIKGHLYNTEAARPVGESRHGDTPGGKTVERLMRTKSGLYFLHCQGGPDTRYAKNVRGEWVPGETIMPLEREAANRWAKKNLGRDEWESEFGSPGDAGERTISVVVPGPVYRRIRDEAADRGCSMGAVIADRFSD